MALNPVVVAQVRADLMEIVGWANRVIVITDQLLVTQILLDQTGRDVDGDTIVTLSNAQKNALQDKAVPILGLLKAKAATLPG